MLDYQRIVDDVRSLIGSQNAEEMDFLRAAAADYSVACDEVNERLSQCGALLRKGLRTEAIQLCEIEPNLLDVVALLDFPERSAWTETANRCGIAPPPALLLDVAAALNEAYALEQPLAALLQQHRLLALTHGSLPTRIQVLRRLAELDVNNAVWQEDLQVFEKERQKQIQAEVESAARSKDTATLAALDAELSDSGWKNPPPPELAKSAAEAHTRLRYWAVQSQFDQLAKELADAMSGYRVELGRTLRDRWNENITTSGWQPHEPIANRVAPALNWLDEQDEIDRQREEHVAATAALEEAAGHGRSVSELQDLHRRAAKLGTVPSDLEERYGSRLALLQRAARWRWWLQLAGIVAGALVVIIGIGMLVSYERYEQQVAEAVKNISFMLEHDHPEQAEALWHKLPERVQQDSRLQELVPKLQEALNKEKVRQAEFSQGVKAANHWLEKVQKDLADKPRQNALNGFYQELDGIEKNLQRTHASARTDEDQAGFKRVTDFLSQVKEALQSQLDMAFDDQCEDFKRQLKKIEGDKSADTERQKTVLSDLREHLRKWELDSDHVTPARLTQITTLRENLSNLEKGVRQQEQEEQYEKEITAGVGNIPNYVKALQEYIQHNPDSDRTPDFKRVVEEALCWQSVAEWDKLAEQSHRTGVAGLWPAAAKEQLSLANNVSDNFADCAECASVRLLLPYLKAIATRDNGGEPIDVPLKKVFADSLVADVWMVEKNDGERYYTSAPPEAGRDTPKPFKYITDFKGTPKGGLLKQSDVKFSGRASQVALAGQVQPILKALHDDNWEKSFCEMIRVIHEDHAVPAVDPILKLNLLQQVLEVGTRGSYCLEKAFGEHLKWIKEARIDAFANWLDPTDAAVDDARKQAARRLDGFSNFEEARKKAGQDWQDLKQRRITEYRWVGWLHSTNDGRWECVMNQPPEDAGRLFVVYRQPDTKLLLSAVGRFDGKTPTIDTAVSSVRVQGRPVYLEVP